MASFVIFDLPQAGLFSLGLNRVLVVEDAQEVQQLIRSYLESVLGISTSGVVTGSEALDAINSFQPDLVILDLSLPDMTGFTVCRQIRQTQKAGKIPVIIVSALDTDLDKEEAERAGGSAYLPKGGPLREWLNELLALLRILEKAGGTVSNE